MTEKNSKAPMWIGLVVIVAAVAAFWAFRGNEDKSTSLPQVTQQQPADTGDVADSTGD